MAAVKPVSGAAVNPTEQSAARVPVEHRFLGLDRRTIPLAAVAVAVWLLWAVVLPWVDQQVAWDDQTRAGDRVQLTDDASFAPATGWGLTSGLRSSDRTSSGRKSSPAVALSKDGVTFFAQQGAWTGTPRALLGQITKITTVESKDGSFDVSTRPTTIVTSSGATGVLEGFRSPRVEGLIAAFVFGDTGVRVQVVGPTDQLAHHAEEIGQMLASIRRDGAVR
jgi:hypothetical protein